MHFQDKKTAATTWQACGASLGHDMVETGFGCTKLLPSPKLEGPILAELGPLCP